MLIPQNGELIKSSIRSDGKNEKIGGNGNAYNKNKSRETIRL